MFFNIISYICTILKAKKFEHKTAKICNEGYAIHSLPDTRNLSPLSPLPIFHSKLKTHLLKIVFLPGLFPISLDYTRILIVGILIPYALSNDTTKFWCLIRVSTDPASPGNPGKTLEFRRILEILEKPWNSVKNPGKMTLKSIFVDIC